MRSRSYDVSTLILRPVPNSTVPSTSAKIVWSRPMPTPRPVWIFVPRWRKIMLPALTSWPPGPEELGPSEPIGQRRAVGGEEEVRAARVAVPTAALGSLRVF